jgi:hypothetical protein
MQIGIPLSLLLHVWWKELLLGLFVFIGCGAAAEWFLSLLMLNELSVTSCHLPRFTANQLTENNLRGAQPDVRDLHPGQLDAVLDKPTEKMA